MIIAQGVVAKNAALEVVSRNLSKGSRRVIVGVRLTRAERAELRRLARTARMSVSDYVRSVLILTGGRP
jgi:hypothetical protein